MESIRELYRTGNGPSSSHTIAPRNAAETFRVEYPEAVRMVITLYGSLAATGKGHMTDRAILEALAGIETEIIWKPAEELPRHPNGMRLEAFNANGDSIGFQIRYSVGGGALRDEDGGPAPIQVYPLTTMREFLKQSNKSGRSFWEYVAQYEGPEIWGFLRDVWQTMKAAIDRGLRAEGVLPGGLGMSRKAWMFSRKLKMAGDADQHNGFLSAYALAVSEENATGGVIVTAPTCGASGVLPAVLRHMQEVLDCEEETILRALATAGLIGNLVKFNASISGAEVGCQGEIGTACAMAAGAAAQLMGATARQIEYAAEMGLEHHLGLTCDPVAGLVQIPCIERNVFAAMRAIDCANYAIFTDGSHRVSFDEVMQVMNETGHDLPTLYRETAAGGLALAYRYPPGE